MIVYGDHAERVRVCDALADIEARLAALPASGLARHAALVAAFIALGQLAQGVADAELAGEPELMATLTALAGEVLRSWDGISASPPSASSEVDERAPGAALPRTSFDTLRTNEAHVELKLPEGYAFYALYPEAYALAARRLTLLAAPRIIGIRSIGTGLSAIVAAALDAPPPLTVRPTGHPFDRRLALPPEIDIQAHHIVVDEGPGLSGSSFAAVARALEQRGVPRERIAFLPGHGGMPGAQASPETHALWEEVQRAVVPLDGLIPPERLAAWIEPLVGSLAAAPEPLREGSRLKFLAQAGGRRWLVKFAGLGAEGERKLALAEKLASAGLIPRVAGLAHGFLVQEWTEAARPDEVTPALADAIADHLATRAALLLGRGGAGASLDALHDMARLNVTEALGHALAERLPPPAGTPRPMPTDNHCDLAKWLLLPDGRVQKADALDHHRAHDLIGCQDPAWDVAGAAVELALDDAALVSFVARFERIGPAIDGALLGFYLPAYCAFRLGAERMFGGTREGFYADRLTTLLGSP